MANDALYPNQLTPENQKILAPILEFRERWAFQPDVLGISRCDLRILLLADGPLDFSDDDFGLSAFVRTLASQLPLRVRLQITIAHIGDAPLDQQLANEPLVTRRIPLFKFDDADHFSSDMYDQVWLFGFQQTFSGHEFRGRPGSGYPVGRLSDRELRAISEFMNGGGGFFATGDHGALGTALGGSVPRVRSMRLWPNPSPVDDPADEVGMRGPRRNDTTTVGYDAISQFSDQSDDIPQTIIPTMFTAYSGFWKFAFPHPLLCSATGVIRVMPDHPHEGECTIPASPNARLNFEGLEFEEYPEVSPGQRLLPVVIATSIVGDNLNAGGSKTNTVGHRFGSISAYDGHRVDLGRVVTDATWHHFVNVNLVGDKNFTPVSELPANDPKRRGFLATAQGQEAFNKIKAYFRNIALWLCRPSQIRCINRRWLWELVYNHRVVEAVATKFSVDVTDFGPDLVYDIGRHARDALGNFAGQCQTRELLIKLIWPEIDLEFIPHIDPWNPFPPPPPEADDRIPWTDIEIFSDLALGGAIVRLWADPVLRRGGREVDDELVQQAVREGARRGFELAVQSAERSLGSFSSQVRTMSRRSTAQ